MIALTIQEKKILFFVVFVTALGLSFSLLRSPEGCQTCLFGLHQEAAASKPVDLNSATREELLLVPGIGPKTAEDILAFRAERGSLKSLDELIQIKGIKEARLERLRPYLRIE